MLKYIEWYFILITYSLMLLFGGVIVGQHLTLMIMNKNLEIEVNKKVELSIENSILRKKIGEAEAMRAIKHNKERITNKHKER